MLQATPTPRMKRAIGRLLGGLALGLPMAWTSWCVAAPAANAATVHNVLVIYTDERLVPANVLADRAFHDAIVSPDERPLNLYSEFLDTTHFSGASYDATVAKYLRDKYALQYPAVIVAVGTDALPFLLRNRAMTFPDIPIVHVGMLRADLLDCVDHILRNIRKNRSPFGGLQILFIGDLLQLPPVVKEDEKRWLNRYYENAFFFQAKALQQSPPVRVELLKIYRQTDQDFIDLLNTYIFPFQYSPECVFPLGVSLLRRYYCKEYL